MQSPAQESGTSAEAQNSSDSSSLDLAYRQRIGLLSITTAGPSVAALRSAYSPQGVLLHSSASNARSGNKAATNGTKTMTADAFLTESECFHHDSVDASTAALATQPDPNALSIRSYAGTRSPTRSPTKQQRELYESRRFRQLYERDKQLRRLLLRDQRWDRQTIEQTFHATFMERRPPAKTP